MRPFAPLSGSFAAAPTDQVSDPVDTPEAKTSPVRRPARIEVPAIASTAGPGLATAMNAASMIKVRWT